MLKFRSQDSPHYTKPSQREHHREVGRQYRRQDRDTEKDKAGRKRVTFLFKRLLFCFFALPLFCNLYRILEETDFRNGRTRTFTNCPTKTIQILAKQLKPTISKLGKLTKATEKNLKIV